MIGFAADGARVPAPAMHMRRIHLGKEDILVDMRKNMQTSQLLAPFGVQATGDFAFQSSSNFVEICRVLRNLLLNHRVIFGTPVKSINDENFCVYVPSYKSISAELTWEVLNCDIEKSAQKLYDIRMKAFRELLTPEEFFRLFPKTRPRRESNPGTPISRPALVPLHQPSRSPLGGSGLDLSVLY